MPDGSGTSILATGSATIPDVPMPPEGYALVVTNLFANAIKVRETGERFWATEAAGVGTIK